MNSAQDYDKMNWMYNALYGELSAEQLKSLAYVESHRALLSRYDQDSLKILDCACGNGVQAAALALNGYSVTAMDLSGEMVKLTEELAQKRGARIETAVKAWSELPAIYKEQFDIVFCTGNSIVHSPDAAARQANIEAMAQALRPGGTLVIETRNWEKIISENKRFTVTEKLAYEGKEYIPLYYWQLSGMENEAQVTILFQEIGNDNRVELYENTLHFTPFMQPSLLDMMEKCGLEIVKDTFADGEGWYVVYGRKG